MGSSKKTAVAVSAALLVVGVALSAGQAAGARPLRLVARLTSSTGAAVGIVRLIPTDDGKVVVRGVAAGLAAGFHGFHVHSTGICDPQAKDATGATVPFFSAGGHYNPVAENIHGAHAGDMPPLLAAQDGTAYLRIKTDRFRLRDLLDDDGSAVIVHAGADNLANIPGATPTGGERYHSHVDNVFGPDTATKATGDAGSRFACGVVERLQG